jgi:hypothetical protein
MQTKSYNKILNQQIIQSKGIEILIGGNLSEILFLE